MDNRSKEPRTIREKLENVVNFKPAMRGGGSVNTYIPVQHKRGEMTKSNQQELLAALIDDM